MNVCQKLNNYKVNPEMGELLDNPNRYTKAEAIR
jgi:hypothetical protein|tara:strand:+ start:412 stop:513 length:102 start_codon:yes stop_codon:yes gene_type:complete